MKTTDLGEQISPETLFTMWERGRGLTRPAQGRAVLRVLGIEEPDLGRLTVGQRDTILVELRVRVFGSFVTSVANCPECGEVLDIGFDVDDIWDIWSVPSQDAETSVEVQHDGYQVRARPPALDDLESIRHPDGDARTALFGRCIVEASCNGKLVEAVELPDDVVARVAQALSEADPHADIRLELVCSGCGHCWTVVFDIVSYLWEELESWVRRMAYDVGVLAARYGWSERDILMMSQNRRELYLEVAQS